MPISPEDNNRNKNIAGPRIREARLEFCPRLTQDQLSGKLAAEGIQLDRVAITKIETGTRCVFDFELRGIARALRVDVGWLLEMKDSPSQSASKRSKGRELQ